MTGIARWPLRFKLMQLSWVCAISMSSVEVGAQDHAAGHVRMALTIDDLPASGASTADWPKARILDRIIAVLREHRVPGAVGFLNGSNMDGQLATRDALAHWLEAGFLLGNHTYSHASANLGNPSAFERDVDRGQALIAELEQPRTAVARYFRYPYLERGGAASDRARILAYLKRNHYRIADVSVDFGDWAFAEVYARCANQGDQDALHVLTNSYLSYAVAELHWAVDSVRRILGRAIPHVLLIHANLMTAHVLHALLSRFEQEGVEFISLDQALEDRVYARTQSSQRGDTSLIGALQQQHGVRSRAALPLPTPLLQTLCR